MKICGVPGEPSQYQALLFEFFEHARLHVVNPYRELFDIQLKHRKLRAEVRAREDRTRSEIANLNAAIHALRGIHQQKKLIRMNTPCDASDADVQPMDDESIPDFPQGDDENDDEVDEEEAEQEASEDELAEAQERSGYNAAVPAAAAASSSSPSRKHQQTALDARIWRGDVKREDEEKWNYLCEQHVKIVTALNSIGSGRSALGDELVSAIISIDLPAYALEDDRIVRLQDSVAAAGVAKQEKSVSLRAQEASAILHRMHTDAGLLMEALFEGAKAQFVLRHLKKQKAALDSSRKEIKMEDSEAGAMDLAKKMTKNHKYADHINRTTSKRQRCGTNQGSTRKNPLLAKAAIVR